MDIFRNIRNDTFGYGGITAKRSKHRKYHDWWFVPLTIADIQVPSTIHIIQLFNCYTSETKNYICWKFPQSWRCCLWSIGSKPLFPRLTDVCTSRICWRSALWESRSVFHLFDKVRIERLAADYPLLQQPEPSETDQSLRLHLRRLLVDHYLLRRDDWIEFLKTQQALVLTGHVQIHLRLRWSFSLLLPTVQSGRILASDQVPNS